jgi:dipeptidyl aminopeptidase/acylaminoacyl peptidase
MLVSTIRPERSATFGFRLCLVSALALTGSVSSVAAAEAPGVTLTPLAAEEVLDAPTLAAYSPAAFSPDNRLLAYVVTDNARRLAAVDDEVLHRTGVAWYGVASDIWISDLETGAGRSLTGGQGNNWAPSWSPDGKYLAFLSDRGSKEPIGPARLWVWERQTDTLRQVGEADVKEGFAGLHWVGNGHSVLVSLFPEELGREGFAALVMMGKARSASTPPRASPDVRGRAARRVRHRSGIASPRRWRRDSGRSTFRAGAAG